jgi:pilus assembly protein CpaF
MSEIFRFSQEGYDANGRVMGKYVATGVVPQLWEEFAERGINMNRDIFKP